MPQTRGSDGRYTSGGGGAKPADGAGGTYYGAAKVVGGPTPAMLAADAASMRMANRQSAARIAKAQARHEAANTGKHANAMKVPSSIPRSVEVDVTNTFHKLLRQHKGKL